MITNRIWHVRAFDAATNEQNDEMVCTTDDTVWAAVKMILGNDQLVRVYRLEFSGMELPAELLEGTIYPAAAGVN